jgi:hypothetical protein
MRLSGFSTKSYAPQVRQHDVDAVLAAQLEPDLCVFGEQRSKPFALKDSLERG